MDKVIGRSPEKQELDDALNSNHAEFIAVYGRRRIGKTYLIKNFFQSKRCVYFQMTGIYQGTLAQHLARFSMEIGTAFYQGASIKPAQNWIEAFDELSRAMAQTPKNKKIVIFIDELPWLASRKSGVVSAIEYFWNRFWTHDKRIKLIVCGSAASWIIKKIIKNKGGLHNRVTRKIQLLPFNLYETAQYLKHLGYLCTQQQVLRLYMAMGGIPFYLNQLKKRESIDQNIDKLLFHPDGALFDEFDEVFSSLFENAQHYKELLTLIGKHKDGVPRTLLNAKAKLTGEGGRLTQRLEDLEFAGFITSYKPYGHTKLGVFYRISDEYCYFYLKWIEPIKRELKQNKTRNYWKSIVGTPAYFAWLGYVFENVCYKHLSQIKSALAIEEESFASPWRYVPRKGNSDKGAQIDLLIDQTDAITLCEMKYTDKPFSIDKHYADVLQQKTEVFRKISRTNKQLFWIMIAANGMKATPYSSQMIAESITLECLFKE